MEASLPMPYLHLGVYKEESHEIHLKLEKRMEHLRVMDLTRHKVEENIKDTKLLYKERHDKPRKKTSYTHCKHGTINKLQKKDHTA